MPHDTVLDLNPQNTKHEQNNGNNQEDFGEFSCEAEPLTHVVGIRHQPLQPGLVHSDFG